MCWAVPLVLAKKGLMNAQDGSAIAPAAGVSRARLACCSSPVLGAGVPRLSSRPLVGGPSLPSCGPGALSLAVQPPSRKVAKTGHQAALRAGA